MKNNPFKIVLAAGFMLAMSFTFGCSGDDGGGGGSHDDDSSSSGGNSVVVGSSSSGGGNITASSSSVGSGIEVSSSSAGNVVVGSSSSGDDNGGYVPPIEIESESIVLADTSTYVGSEKVQIYGKFLASRSDPILSLEFTPSGWVKYKGEVQTSKITGLSETFINLNNSEVDLSNPAIMCGTNICVAVVACASGNKCTNGLFCFEKPAELCSTSSSSGGGVSSSSQQVMWTFGAQEGPLSFSDGNTKSISGFSITLRNKEANGVQIVEISISDGNIRYTNVNYVADNDTEGFDNYPEPNHPYPNSIFKLMQSPVTSLEIENLNEYYIITGSNDRYLIRVEPVGGPGTPPDWPMKVRYWKVTDGPSF